MADIQFENVGKHYGGQWVLRGFFAVLHPGDAVAVMGPSGGGKTTLARLLMGLEVPDEGRLAGAQGLGFCPVFQENRLAEGLTALQNVALLLPRGAQKRAAAALQRVGLAKEEIAKPVAALSGGQKRRVALVRAVEATGQVLLLDEAFKGLDENTKQLAYSYIKQNLGSRTLVVITHDETEAAALCNRTLRVG